MPTLRQDKEFAESICNPQTLLDNAIEWIAANLQPNEVFSEKTLEEWATDNGYSKQ